MTSWEFIIIIGCAVGGFLLVSFVLEVFASHRKLLSAGFVLTILLLVGYAVAPSDLWSPLTGRDLSDSGSTLAQTANIARSRAGNFAVIAQVNGSSIAFVIDTGASAVTLTQDAAKAAKLPLGSLIYSVDIETANGPTRAAAITLGSLRVGGITERSVSALVAPPGKLNTSLLGMSFLNRLGSWQVRDDRLIMQGYP